MATEPTTVQTAIMAAQNDTRLRAAMFRLLHGLERCMGVYPFHQDDKMPEHRVVWMTEIGPRGPDGTILDAIKMHPELWAHALPEDCCIVPRKLLEKYLSADAVEALAGYGAHAVDNQAARLRYEAEELERRNGGR